MTISAIVHQVVTTGTPVMVRSTGIIQEVTQYTTRSVTTRRAGNKPGKSKSRAKRTRTKRPITWLHMDLPTASVIQAVYDVLTETNRARFDNMPLDRLVDFCWRKSLGM